MSWSTVTNGVGGGAGAATTSVATLGLAVSVNDLVVVFVNRGTNSGDDGSTTCADSVGNTYISPAGAHAFDSANGQGMQWFYCFVTSAGTPTITASHPSHPDRGIAAQAYRSSLGLPTLDIAGGTQISTTANTNPDNVTCTSVTPSSDGDLLLAFMANTSVGGTTFVAGTGFTVDVQTGLAGSYTAIERLFLGAGTNGNAQSPTGSDPTSGARVLNGAALFREPAAGGAAVRRRGLLGVGS